MSARRILLRSIAFALVVVPLFVGNVACRPTMAPVFQVSGARLTPYAGGPLADAEVREVLVRGVTTKRWTVTEEQPGALFAEIREKGHYAKVRIDYNAAGYAISYVDSSPSFHYDGVNIHRRYNHWVRMLNDSIQRAFMEYQQARRTGSVAPSTPAVAAPSTASPDAAPTPSVPAQ